jgi:hypothetical protein
MFFYGIYQLRGYELNYIIDHHSEEEEAIDLKLKQLTRA